MQFIILWRSHRPGKWKKSKREMQPKIKEIFRANQKKRHKNNRTEPRCVNLFLCVHNSEKRRILKFKLSKNLLSR